VPWITPTPRSWRLTHADLGVRSCSDRPRRPDRYSPPSPVQH
jgi:hypothetical protein